MQTDSPHPIPHASETPRGYTPRSEDAWDLARSDYHAGASKTQVCVRYGLSPSTFDDRARRHGWRNCDLPDPDPIPDDDPEADQPVDCAALAEDALVRVRRALRLGRASEAASWMRLHDRLNARLEAARAQMRRRERIAAARGSDGAEDPLVAALRPLRERMAFINSLGAAQLRVSRAWRKDLIPAETFKRFNALHSGVADAYEQQIAAAATALTADPDPRCSHPDFSVSDDP